MKQISKWKEFKKPHNRKEGFIFNISIAYYEDPKWVDKIQYFKNIIPSLPNIVDPDFGQISGGVSIQMFIDFSDKEAIEFSEKVFNDFEQNIVIVFKKIELTIKYKRIGIHYEDSLVEPGRLFDKKMKNKEFGIYNLDL
jgi:hypothetical protein